MLDAIIYNTPSIPQFVDVFSYPSLISPVSSLCSLIPPVYLIRHSSITTTSSEPDTSSVSSSPSSTSQHGIIPRLIHDIFDTIESADEDIDFTIKVSMLEVYLERIRDLLNPINDNLKVRESANGVWVDDLTECYVASVDEVLGKFSLLFPQPRHSHSTFLFLLSYHPSSFPFVIPSSVATVSVEFIAAGNAARSVGETNMNEKSSRSHSVVILTIGTLLRSLYSSYHPLGSISHVFHITRSHIDINSTAYHLPHSQCLYHYCVFSCLYFKVKTTQKQGRKEVRNSH